MVHICIYYSALIQSCY